MKTLWPALSGAIAQQHKVDTHANNVANGNTVGFKKDTAVFKEYLTALDKPIDHIHVPQSEWSPGDFYHTLGKENALVSFQGNYTSFEQGILIPTHNKLDFALQGQGFFEILTPTGVVYTRNGQFSLNKEGQLVDSQGNFVLQKGTQSPEERKITLDSANFLVTSSGEIRTSQGDQIKLSVQEFQDSHALIKIGGNLFKNIHPENSLSLASKTLVHQGHIESSNVNPLLEMSELIKAHRNFDLLNNTLKTFDTLSGKSIDEIGQF